MPGRRVAGGRVEVGKSRQPKRLETRAPREGRWRSEAMRRRRARHDKRTCASDGAPAAQGRGSRELEGEWRSARTTSSCAPPGRAEAGRVRAQARGGEENTSRGLRMQLDQAKISTRSSGGMTRTAPHARARAAVLTSSLDRLSKELERECGPGRGRCQISGRPGRGCIPAARSSRSALKVFAWNPRAEGLWNRPAGRSSGGCSELGVKESTARSSTSWRRSTTEGRLVGPGFLHRERQGAARAREAQAILGPQAAAAAS